MKHFQFEESLPNVSRSSSIATWGRWRSFPPCIRPDGGDAANPQGADLRVTLNWFEELKQRVPAD